MKSAFDHILLYVNLRCINIKYHHYYYIISAFKKMTLQVKQRSCKLLRATYPVVLMEFLNRANQITAKALA